MFRFLISFIIMSSGALSPTIAFAKPPVVVEFFGRNSCSPDTAAQESLQEMLKTENNVILINCRKYSIGNKTIKSYTHQFCSDRSKAYNDKYKFAFTPPSLVIVNGHLDANYNDVVPTVNYARIDNIATIAVGVHNNILDISIPEISSDIREGDIILYSYMPTIDNEIASRDEPINENISVPFVTKTRKTPLYLRPVLTRDNIGRWRGKAMDLTMSLSDITSFAGSSYGDLSYVVLIHKGDDLGAIIAAGEDISLKEYSNTLPHSKPANIKFVSQPDPSLNRGL